MAKSSKSSATTLSENDSPGPQKIKKNIKFIVPLPGKGSWHNHPTHYSSKKIHKFSRLNKEMALEDFQAHFLMEREYPID